MPHVASHRAPGRAGPARDLPLIAVFGATGAQGGGLARAILGDPKRRFRVRALTRRPFLPAARTLAERGAEIVMADLDDAASVRRAMDGAHGAFCVTDYRECRSPRRENAQAKALAEAAAAAGVAHVIWSTLEDTRDYLPLDSGRLPVLAGGYLVPHYDGKGEANRAFTDRVPTTLLYTSFQWDNLIRYGMQPRRGPDGELAFALPMGAAKLPGMGAEDIGPCAFGIFARGAALIGKSVGVAGEHLSGAEMAAALSRALGEPVTHAARMCEPCAARSFASADDLANMFAFLREHEHGYRASRSVACGRELHPGLLDFAGWLERNARRIPVSELSPA